jgi:hypothetical protein
MGNGRSKLRGRLKTAVAALRAAGVEVARIEIGNDDRLVVFTSSGVVPPTIDDDLDRELADWSEGRHGQG